MRLRPLVTAGASDTVYADRAYQLCAGVLCLLCVNWSILRRVCVDASVLRDASYGIFRVVGWWFERQTERRDVSVADVAATGPDMHGSIRDCKVSIRSAWCITVYFVPTGYDFVWFHCWFVLLGGTFVKIIIASNSGLDVLNNPPSDVVSHLN